LLNYAVGKNKLVVKGRGVFFARVCFAVYIYDVVFDTVGGPNLSNN